MADTASDDNVSILTHNHSVHHSYEEWDPFENNYAARAWSMLSYSVSIVCPIAIFCGVFTNILALVVLVRSRLWLKHEGYVYLAAIFCVNVGILLFCTSSFWVTSVYESHYYPANSSNFVCKVWHFFMSVFFFASGWLSVALLFSVYLREHLINRRRCGCPMFAAKYCTLFASKVVVGVIFSVLFICGIPYLALFEIPPSHSFCYVYPSKHLAFGVALMVESILMWVLPFVVFLPIILLITLCTKKEGNVFGFSQIEERSASDEQMRVLAVMLSSMILFSQFVLVVIHIVFVSEWFVSVIIEMVFGLSVCVPPILCFLIRKTLREEFCSQLRSICCCRRLFPSLDRGQDVVQLTAIQEDPPSTES